VSRLDNLTPFTSENQPENRGRPKGSVNRSTIAKKWLSVETTDKNPITQIEEKLDQADLIILNMIKEARAGNVQAANLLLDSAFGKLTQPTDVTVSQGILNIDPLNDSGDNEPQKDSPTT
jgi:hypothetical protein